MEQATILDLDAILDGNLDAVADVPDFVDPPDGVYMIKVHEAEVLAARSSKEAVDKPRANQIVLTYTVISTVETKNIPVADGSLFSERFQGTEEGLAYFKRQAKNLLQVENVDGAPVRDILSTLKESPAVQVVITHSTSKGADGKDYTNLRMRVAPPAK